jgi:F0F1-type ATP synthase membrane subunit c/vacuolar-type H+-ATPase subunit K
MEPDGLIMVACAGVGIIAAAAVEARVRTRESRAKSVRI